MQVEYDTVIVGGGIAGLQTAIQLARCLRRVAVIDMPGGRSTIAKAYRNILGFSEGVSGDFLRQAGRQQAQKYGANLITDEVIKLSTDPSGLFSIGTKGSIHTFTSRTLVLATGIRDPFPAIPGFSDCVGISIFLCPDCDGYETVEKDTAIIGVGQHAVSMADELIYYTNRLTVINHAEVQVDSQAVSGMSQRGIKYREEKVYALHHTAGQLQEIELSSGERLSVERAFLAFPGAHALTELLRGFSVQIHEKGHIHTNPRTKETDHPNIWAVGDINEHSQQVSVAMGDGTQAAIWIQKRLREYET
ncbi:NAD(P)/FAD-dependent oxidoreductase [Brevibacillus antibioticus]|uniref:NAD(P)/FAD-dependent oxidoreductase n=1 Tax=Brevibacillus antibioticus TaxID=2570228 RepID=A0A4U2Y5Q3_9BACL|nr:NAD(P)/FAD-dependent oxidoreductase [Brevibacillus antibioticus]TKI55858.1 NAD(P)/FAD-dependent oxidoreductase [Brevibacillus antibioticus]